MEEQVQHSTHLTFHMKLKELLGGMCKDVHSKEDYTLRYMMTEQLDAETPDIVMIETYVAYVELCQLFSLFR